MSAFDWRMMLQAVGYAALLAVVCGVWFVVLLAYGPPL